MFLKSSLQYNRHEPPIFSDKDHIPYVDYRTFQTSFQADISTCRGMRAGVAQGGLVSSVLFSLHVKYIPTPSHHVELAPYADDTAVAATFRGLSLLVSYLAYLGRLERWLRYCHNRAEEHCCAHCQGSETHPKTYSSAVRRRGNRVGRNSAVSWGDL
jgi:hypothetical protein